MYTAGTSIEFGLNKPRDFMKELTALNDDDARDEGRSVYAATDRLYPLYDITVVVCRDGVEIGRFPEKVPLRD